MMEFVVAFSVVFVICLIVILKNRSDKYDDDFRIGSISPKRRVVRSRKTSRMAEPISDSIDCLDKFR